MSTKNQLRKRILDIRNSLNIKEMEDRSKIVIDKLKRDPDFINAHTIMFYISKGNEVNTHDIIQETTKTKKVIVPKISDKGLLCCHLSDLKKTHFDCFGILEPDDTILCDISGIDLIIVPGIVFDKRGHRIGYGKGFYDALLKQSKAKKIGLAFDFQIVEKISEDDWDIKLDKVFSD
jgi:5-formyltetrahydrofolate cyclo-ligase